MDGDRPGRRLKAAVWTCVTSALLVGAAGAIPGGPTDGVGVRSMLADFYGPGSQPGRLVDPLVEAPDCALCHGGYNEAQEPYTRWTASMMGQGARDPIFWAAMAIAEQAAPNVTDLCVRCHAPRNWIELGGRPSKSAPPTGHADEGISCSICHRMVDPVYRPGISPAEDAQVLAGVPKLPVAYHSAQFVLDPQDRRRGPFQLSVSYHEWLRSPLHSESRMCGTCHDVSNPLFVMQPDGRYALDTLGKPHPTHRPYEEFPLERTYSEWSQSEFARGPIDMGGRFGGNQAQVSSCQDCHMPKTTGTACLPVLGGAVRSDLPQHDFRGATTWMLHAVRNLYPDGETGLTADSVADAVARNQEMLRRASDVHLAVSGGSLIVRIINQTGHKLPTGHLEGRRMWVNVRFLDGAGALVQEFGAYDPVEATLNAAGTKVYQAIVGLDETMAVMLGVPAGPSHLFPLNNKFYQDNRIPPRGFTNAGFAAVQCAPVGQVYHDGQFWDDSRYPIPVGAARAEARLYYQTITREAVEGLRDANTTNSAGQILYEQWDQTGRSAPVEMDLGSLAFAGYCRADFSGNGTLGPPDFGAYLDAFSRPDPRADVNDDGVLNVNDFMAFLNLVAQGCP